MNGFNNCVAAPGGQGATVAANEGDPTALRGAIGADVKHKEIHSPRIVILSIAMALAEAAALLRETRDQCAITMAH